jgi:putative DNA primase/helicase
MKRKTAKDKVEDFHGQYPYPELETLKRQAWRWTRDNLKLIRNAEPPMPAGLINRTKDNWSPLFVIAQVAGGEWPNKCLDAVLAFQESRPDETSVGVMLLTDLQELFRESEGKPLPTEEILKSLATMDERPWPEWKKGKPITARQLAKLLKPFGVTSKNVRFGDKIPKGYELSDCQEAFARYIASNPLHPLQDNKNNDLGPLSDPLQTGNVADQKSDLSNGKQSNVADVADRDPWDGND